MKYQLSFTINIPEETKYILYYTKKSGETKFYPISELITQDNKYLKAEVLGSGPRTFINERIINMQPIKQ